MKKYILFLAGFVIVMTSSAKKVKFAVDMAAQTVNPTGVHLTGDFQNMLGLAGGDWQANTITLLPEESDSNHFSVILDLPAFHKYEYKFVNGDQFYEVEFVPVESRVGYDFNDNRWLYVDSLANDTTFVGAIRFGENSPEGLTLMRFLVDMSHETVDANGVHLFGDIQGWDAAATFMYSFVSGTYEIIAYTLPGTHSYRFLNGNEAGTSESIPDACNLGGSRSFDLVDHTVLNTVCFSSCTQCEVVIGMDEIQPSNLSIYPNPMTDRTIIQIGSNDNSLVRVCDTAGRLIFSKSTNGKNLVELSGLDLTSGLYCVQVVSSNGNTTAISKLIVE